jgi:hypothetical protein
MALIGNYNDVPLLHDVVFVVEDTSLNGTYIDVTIMTFFLLNLETFLILSTSFFYINYYRLESMLFERFFHKI